MALPFVVNMIASYSDKQTMISRYLLLRLLTTRPGLCLCFAVGFMSAFTAPTPRGVYGLTPVRRELMG